MAAATLAAALMLPVAAAAPAQAATETPKVQAFGCTVTAEKPQLLAVRDPYDRREIVRLESRVSCTQRANLKVVTEALENDGGWPVRDLDLIGKRAKELTVLPHLIYRVTWDLRVPDWDDDHKADIIQKVTFSRNWETPKKWRDAGYWAESRETVIPIRYP